MRNRPATGPGETAVPRWASKRYATTCAVRAGHDAAPGRLRGHGGGGLRRCAHHDGTGNGTDGGLAQPRPASARTPSAARPVTITQLPSLDPHVRHPAAPVTITDPPVVRQLAALVDDLQLSTIGSGAPCPLPIGGGIRLTFLARAGGPPLAVAQGPAACGTVQFSVGGKQQPALQITDSFIPQVLMLADLHWKVQ